MRKASVSGYMSLNLQAFLFHDDCLLLFLFFSCFLSSFEDGFWVILLCLWCYNVPSSVKHIVSVNYFIIINVVNDFSLLTSSTSSLRFSLNYFGATFGTATDSGLRQRDWAIAILYHYGFFLWFLNCFLTFLTRLSTYWHAFNRLTRHLLTGHLTGCQNLTCNWNSWWWLIWANLDDVDAACIFLFKQVCVFAFDGIISYDWHHVGCNRLTLTVCRFHQNWVLLFKFLKLI